MGAYTSFPMFALAHHVLVRIAAQRAGKIRYANYAILGDDVLLSNIEVVEQYRKLLSQLNVKISESKSYQGNLVEFAKRHFYKGEEITGYSMSGLRSSWRSYPLLLNFLDQMESRGLKPSTAQASLGFVNLIYTKLRPWFVTKVITKCKVFNQIREAIRGNIDVVKTSTEFPNAKDFSDDQIKTIIQRSFTNEVGKSVIKVIKKDIALKEL